MLNSTKRSLVLVALAAVAFATTGCPGSGGLPSRPGAGPSSVDPNTCGNYAASDAGRKLKAFLEATVALEGAVKNSENYVMDTCVAMGKELGLTGLSGNTGEVCAKVNASLKEHLQLGLTAGAALKIDYKPAVCTVNVEAAASAAAKCEAKAEADVSVRCEGVCQGTCSGGCSGTCSGTCDGTCDGKAGTAGTAAQCEGQCQGTCEGSCSATCEGSCSGGCEGHASVDADASCQAKAEVTASVDAKCSEPELTIEFDAGVVVDKSKVDMAVAAIKAGLPRMLQVKARIEGPVAAAFKTWATASANLAKAGRDLYASLGDQARCVTGQIAAAGKMLGSIQASLDIQVSVSVEASASAGASGGASGGTR